MNLKSKDSGAGAGAGAVIHAFALLNDFEMNFV